MIKLNHLSFAYGTRSILENVDLTIFEPGFYGILGPNGSGKTTLLKLICGILVPTQGSILMDQVDMKRWNRKEMAKHIAYVPQHFNLNYDFKVEEVVAMGRHPYHNSFDSLTKEEYHMIDHALELTGLTGFKQRSINKLSGGEMQRVIIARALVQDTPVIILDEPVSNLDIHYQKEIITLLQDIAVSQNKLIITVLHDINIGMNYCDKVYLIQDGKIVFGEPKEILTLELIESIYKTKVHMVQNDGQSIVYW